MAGHVGLISYGMYMYHQPIQGLCHAIFGNQAPKLTSVADVFISILSAAISFGLAYISYHFAEAHLLALGHRSKWWPAKPKVAVQQEELAKVA